MTCPQCQQQGLTIQRAQDSHYKEVFCPACLWRSWLKNFNSLRKAQDNPRQAVANKKKTEEAKKQLAQDFPMSAQALKNKSAQAYEASQDNFN